MQSTYTCLALVLAAVTTMVRHPSRQQNTKRMRAIQKHLRSSRRMDKSINTGRCQVMSVITEQNRSCENREERATRVGSPVRPVLLALPACSHSAPGSSGLPVPGAVSEARQTQVVLNQGSWPRQ